MSFFKKKKAKTFKDELNDIYNNSFNNKETIEKAKEMSEKIINKEIIPVLKEDAKKNPGMIFRFASWTWDNMFGRKVRRFIFNWFDKEGLSYVKDDKNDTYVIYFNNHIYDRLSSSLSSLSLNLNSYLRRYS
jgi:hypothetical protein